MPTKKVKKQKQKQKQQQSVVVNVNTGTRRRASRRKAPTRSGGGGGGGGRGGTPYPVYVNSPSDYAPIVHNLPSQFQNQPAISMPVQALVNIPTGQTQPTVLPTTLQTNTADNKPITLAIKPRPSTPPTKPPQTGSLAEQILKEHAKRAEKKLAKERALVGVQEAVKEPGSNIPRSTAPSPFQVELLKKIEQRASPQLPSQFTSTPPLSPLLVKPIPRPVGRPREFTDEQRAERQEYANTQEGKREMAERQLFAREDPKSAKFGRK